MSSYLVNWFKRHRSPKDFAYSVYAEFGPDLRIDRQERLESKFPKIDPSQIREWIEDFEQLEKAVWSVANAGGTVHNSRKEVVAFLQQRYPWLEGVGLRTAISRSDYLAWHEGYHLSPSSTLQREQAEQGAGSDPHQRPC